MGKEGLPSPEAANDTNGLVMLEERYGLPLTTGRRD